MKYRNLFPYNNHCQFDLTMQNKYISIYVTDLWKDFGDSHLKLKIVGV